MAKKTDLERQLQDLDRLREREVISDDEHAEHRRAILAAAPAVDPAKRSGARGIFKWGFFGCLGVSAAIIIVFIGSIALIAASIDSGDEGSDVRVTLEPGASGEIFPEFNDDRVSRVTILQINEDVAPGAFSAVPDGKKIWGVEVLVENVGEREVTSLDWKLRDSEDFEHDREFFIDAEEQLEVLYADLTPGARVQGWVYFELNESATAKWLRADPNPFVANDLYFDAE